MSGDPSSLVGMVNFHANGLSGNLSSQPWMILTARYFYLLLMNSMVAVRSCSEPRLKSNFSPTAFPVKSLARVLSGRNSSRSELGPGLSSRMAHFTSPVSSALYLTAQPGAATGGKRNLPSSSPTPTTAT